LKARKWQMLETERVYSTPIFDIHRRRSAHPRRGERNFFVLEAPGWVNIIPLTRSRDVIFVRQFRHGVSAFTLEIPGGMIDPEDPTPAYAAAREMREECGYDSDDIVALGRVHPNPAIQPNFCYSFLARNVHKVGEPRHIQDSSEETEVVTVPLRDVPSLIATGKITHALVIAAFSFFHVYNPPPRSRRKAT
jgi:ADP-ribose pyrophosphatase